MNEKSSQREIERLKKLLTGKDAEIRALIDACRKITSSLNVEEVLLFIQQSARRLMNAKSSSVILLDSSGEYLQIASSTGAKEDEVKGLRFPADKGVAGWVVQHREPVIVDDVDSDPRFYSLIDQQSGFRTERIFCAPMIFREQMLGVIEVLNYELSGRPPQSVIELFNTFADLAAVALKNAISFDNLSHSYKLLSEQARREGTHRSGNRAMRKVYEMCSKVAPLESTVFLRGESGTGKELLADLIHAQSGRSDKLMLKVNVAALPENLVESELFGHEKGAFTGAVGRKRGKFELADRGTIFLDEIGELRPDIQVKLLRFLQEHTFERLGGSETIKVDVRIIAATNRNMDQALSSGDFRTDLYYRLNVVPLQVPPLRERTEDIPLLVDFFIDKFNTELNRKVEGVAPDALERLLHHSWPGNIRELENIIERIMVMREQGIIQSEDIPAEIGAGPAGSVQQLKVTETATPTGLHDMEQRLILETLEANAYNQSRTARRLGITLNQLRYRIKRYRIEIKKS